MNLPNKRILIIEDEQAIRSILRKRLEANGYDVIVAEDGEEGLAVARQEKPDLILLDVMLPKRDGYSVCRLLKFDQRYRHIPVVMLTARAQEKDQKLGQQTGADAYVTKPFDAAELLATISSMLKDS
ncbi:MAG: hypothetical protein A2Y95_11655 [Deltaproteobacteria bacterium RBG_13_65_10]|nr:MAG: hypothetical protein A2Y95_11655 [Deltaproteobacteria bacterium RBG_13_65_10]